MTRRHVTRFTVEFGDCDPAQIVFYPNFFRWMDAAALHFFRAAGVPLWRDYEAQTGILGTPLVDATARFLRPASYGDVIDVETTIAEWRGRSFVMAHVIRRGDTVLVEGREVRVFARRHPDDPSRIQAVDVPAAIRASLDPRAG
jgi:4-hydroxybenzoyl-CoA thioesterase